MLGTGKNTRLSLVVFVCCQKAETNVTVLDFYFSQELMESWDGSSKIPAF